MFVNKEVHETNTDTHTQMKMYEADRFCQAISANQDEMQCIKDTRHCNTEIYAI